MKKKQIKTPYFRRERGRTIYYQTKGEMTKAQKAFEKKQEEKKERAAIVRDIAIVNKRLKRLKAAGMESTDVYQNALVAVNQFNKMIAKEQGKSSPALTYDPKFSLPRGISRDLMREIGYHVRLVKEHGESTVRGVKKALVEMAKTLPGAKERSWRDIDRHSDRYRDLISIFTVLRRELEKLGISSDQVMDSSYEIMDNPDINSVDLVDWVHELNEKIDTSDPALRLYSLKGDMIMNALDAITRGKAIPPVDDEIDRVIQYRLSKIQRSQHENDEFLEAIKRRKT